MKVLLLPTITKHTISSNTQKLVNIGAELQGENNLSPIIDLLLVGFELTNVQDVKGVDNVFIIDNEVYEDFDAENISEAVISFLSNNEGYTHVFSPINSYWSEILPRVAARLDSIQISEVVDIPTTDEFISIEAGINNQYTYVTYENTSDIKFASIDVANFIGKYKETTYKNYNKIKLDLVFACKKFIVDVVEHNNKSDLKNANVVIVGGRGLKSKDEFVKLNDFARKINATVGATRGAVEAGYASCYQQVGQTGVTIAPDVYIAFAVSGAIQHLYGINNAKVIIAINNNSTAPIHNEADYSLIMDYEQVLQDLL